MPCSSASSSSPTDRTRSSRDDATLRLLIKIEAARALTEGAVLARYRYTVLKSDPKHTLLRTLALQIDGTEPGAAIRGSSAGLVAARAAIVARDLANTPPGHLTAVDIGEIATSLGERFDFDVELFDKAALIELGCGGGCSG